MFLLNDISGSIVIESLWGHSGSSFQFFYSINENGELLLLDAIFSYDFDKELHALTGEMIRSRIRNTEGNEIHLSEMEYIMLMYKYGSIGYELFLAVSEEEFIDWMRIYHPCEYEQFQGFEDNRRVSLEWEYVVPLENTL